MGIYGQDWASYQSAQPDTTDLSFVFIKVTEGAGYVNPLWQAQLQWARSRGLVAGLYHYPHMGNSVDVELGHFLTAAGQAIQPGVMLCLDWEGYDSANASVPHAQQLAFKDQFLGSLKAREPHNPAGVYMNTDYLANVDGSGRHGDFLWIATSGRPAGNPGINANWLFHQYSDMPVDSDYCPLGSVAELRTWAMSFAQATPATTPPQEDPMDAAQYAEFKGILFGVSNDLKATRADVDTLFDTSRAMLFGISNDLHAGDNDLKTLLAAQSAAVTALAAQLGQQHDGVDTAQVVAAVQAAISAAVVKVDVAVTQAPAPPTSSS